MNWELRKTDLTINKLDSVIDLHAKVHKIKRRIENDVNPISETELKRVSQIARDMLDTCLLRLGKATLRGDTIYDSERVSILKKRTWNLVEHTFKNTNLHYFYNGTEDEYNAKLEESDD